MQVSKHAIVRSKQRGIPSELIKLIVDFGVAEKKPGDTLEYRLRKKDKEKLIKYYKRKIQLLDNINSKAVLVNSNTDEIITVYNLYCDHI